VGSFVMVSGILTLAVPITLIGNRFNDVRPGLGRIVALYYRSSASYQIH
jgi:hypothetical protein